MAERAGHRGAWGWYARGRLWPRECVRERPSKARLRVRRSERAQLEDGPSAESGGSRGEAVRGGVERHRIPGSAREVRRAGKYDPRCL